MFVSTSERTAICLGVMGACVLMELITNAETNYTLWPRDQ
jgi:hypothetical protein